MYEKLITPSSIIGKTYEKLFIRFKIMNWVWALGQIFKKIIIFYRII
jgi:hypothetical protein